MSEFLDITHAAMKRIIDASYELEMLSNAFYVTGNNVMGNALRDIAKNLMEDQKKIGDAISMDINEKLGENYRFAGDMLCTILDKVEKK